MYDLTYEKVVRMFVVYEIARNSHYYSCCSYRASCKFRAGVFENDSFALVAESSDQPFTGCCGHCYHFCRCSASIYYVERSFFQLGKVVLVVKKSEKLTYVFQIFVVAFVVVNVIWVVFCNYWHVKNWCFCRNV